jgi:uncharacterized membrane protein YfcA
MLNLWLVPAVLVGGVTGRWAIGRINQKWFEFITLGLTACAALKLILA